jgi:hypothetical protein
MSDEDYLLKPHLGDDSIQVTDLIGRGIRISGGFIRSTPVQMSPEIPSFSPEGMAHKGKTMPWVTIAAIDPLAVAHGQSTILLASCLIWNLRLDQFRQKSKRLLPA